MTRAWRMAAIVASTALILGSVGALARLPYASPDADTALLRLSWRVRATGEEVCRKLSDEELEALPVHMRRPEVCERDNREYELLVSVDERVVADTTVTGAGVHADRPLFVFREVRLAPGRHIVEVTFRPSDADAATTGADGVEKVRYDLITEIGVQPGDVVLITRDEATDALVVRTPPATGRD